MSGFARKKSETVRSVRHNENALLRLFHTENFKASCVDLLHWACCVCQSPLLLCNKDNARKGSYSFSCIGLLVLWQLFLHWATQQRKPCTTRWCEKAAKNAKVRAATQLKTWRGTGRSNWVVLRLVYDLQAETLGMRDDSPCARFSVFSVVFSACDKWWWMWVNWARQMVIEEDMASKYCHCYGWLYHGESV